MYLISKERIFFYECTKIHYYEKSGKKKKKLVPSVQGLKIIKLKKSRWRYQCVSSFFPVTVDTGAGKFSK